VALKGEPHRFHRIKYDTNGFENYLANPEASGYPTYVCINGTGTYLPYQRIVANYQKFATTELQILTRGLQYILENSLPFAPGLKY
jgi:hypothetical protein